MFHGNPEDDGGQEQGLNRGKSILLIVISYLSNKSKTNKTSSIPIKVQFIFVFGRYRSK